MDIVEEIDQVVITMSPDEFATFRRTYQTAWNFVRHAFMKALEPQGRTFGKPVMENLAREELKGVESEPTCVTPELLDRIAALESKVSWIQESAGEAQNEIERRIAGLEVGAQDMSMQGNADRDRLNELTAQVSEIQNRLDTYGVPVAARRPEDRARGVEIQALNTAEDRIRRYMTGHWSDPAVEGVIAALRGTQADDPSAGRVVRRPNPFMPLVTTHAFQYSAPDRRHCSFQVGDDGARCGQPRHQHSQA